MASIGETLRRDRLKSGLELDKVARDTKISLRFLQAIERDDFEKLPGGVFTKSFVRQYARYLGIDDTDLLAELHQRLEPQPEPAATPGEGPKPEAPPRRAMRFEPMSEARGPASSLPALALVVVVMLLCSFIYAWWQNARRTPVTAAVQPAPLPPVAERQAPATPPEPVPAAKTESAAPEHAAKPESAAAPLQVSLTAEEASWISATLKGKQVYAGVLQPKETKTLQSADVLKLVIGNAGGVTISLNGKPIAPVGARGQVRVIQLTPGGTVQVVPPKPVTPPDIL